MVQITGNKEKIFGVMVLWPVSQPSDGGLMTATQGRGVGSAL